MKHYLFVFLFLAALVAKGQPAALPTVIFDWNKGCLVTSEDPEAINTQLIPWGRPFLLKVINIPASVTGNLKALICHTGKPCKETYTADLIVGQIVNNSCYILFQKAASEYNYYHRSYVLELTAGGITKSFCYWTTYDNNDNVITHSSIGIGGGGFFDGRGQACWGANVIFKYHFGVIDGNLINPYYHHPVLSRFSVFAGFPITPVNFSSNGRNDILNLWDTDLVLPFAKIYTGLGFDISPNVSVAAGSLICRQRLRDNSTKAISVWGFSLNVGLELFKRYKNQYNEIKSDNSSETAPATPTKTQQAAKPAAAAAPAAPAAPAPAHAPAAPAAPAQVPATPK